MSEDVFFPLLGWDTTGIWCVAVRSTAKHLTVHSTTSITINQLKMPIVLNLNPSKETQNTFFEILRIH